MLKRLQKNAFYMLGVVMMLCAFTACEKDKDGDDIIIDADSGKFVQVPDPDTWVKDDDIKMDDLDQLVDLAVKVERMRQEFVLMLSDGGEGDNLFCGVGPKTDVGPTIKLFTDMMLKQDEYEAALDRLDGTAILKQTSTRGPIKDGKTIVTVAKTEAEREKEIVQDILNKNKVYGNANAQKQLYDFYCEQEPDYAKKIDAKDAEDFFKKLNNGELNGYMLNISHIWRDKGIMEADKPNSAVGDYAYEAFTGKAEYANSAYRVSSKIAVAAGDLYLTAIDKVAGGYGAKIMEFGDAIEKRITKLKALKKLYDRKLTMQEINTIIVKDLADDIKAAISDALGDDENIGTELVNMVTEEICDYLVEQCTVESGSDDSSEEAKKKQDEEAKAADLAVLNIETDFTSQGKMILITDESTGKVNVATPTYDGHVTLVTTAGNKIITVIKNNGERLTRKVTVVEGTNTVIIKSEQKPYIDLNPSSFTLEDKAGSETAVVLTNCKYIKLRQTTKEDWCDVQLEINGSAGRGFHVRVVAKANLDSKDRSGTFILEGYEEAKEGSKPVVTKTFRFTQYAYTPELTPIDVSPTALTFDASGGEKILTLNIKDYKYYGGFNDEASDEWLSVVINDNKTLTVKAKPNDTGAERYGTIYAFGTDDPDPKTLDQVAFKAIPVTQPAREATNLVIESIYIMPNVFFYWHKDKIDQTNDYWSILPNYYTTLDNIKVSDLGNGNLYIKGTFNGTYAAYAANEDASVTIEIENASKAYDQWVIKSLDLDLHWYRSDNTSWWDCKTNFKANNIPCWNKESYTELIFSGKKADGVTGFGFSGVYKGNNGDGSYSYDLKLKEDDYNEVEVIIKLAQ